MRRQQSEALTAGIAAGTSLLRSLGWIWPRLVYVIVGLIVGVLLAAGVVLYLGYCHRSTPRIALTELLLPAISLAPILEESFFRGCLLPLIGQATGNILAVILTGLLFALLHQPTDLAHWVSFIATGLAYGWMRIASGSTSAAAVMHATYNLALFLCTML